MLRRTACAGFFVMALLGMPRPGEAGLIEFIWKMSGPQFLGLGAGCTFDTKLVRQNCKLGTAAFKLQQERDRRRFANLREQTFRGPFIFVGGELQFSTGLNDADGTDYKVGQIWRGALTPALSFWAFDVKQTPIYVGAGVSWDLLFGKDFSAFDKFAITVTPAEALLGRSKKHSVALKLRIYPNAYTSDEFGFGPRRDYNRPTEVAFGFSYSYFLGSS
jgi:hypothetical protein